MGHHHSGKNIGSAFFLNLFFTIVEVVGGIWTGSMAILSDALHDLGDSMSLGFSWWMERRSGNREDEEFTLGYRRFSLLGALINSLVLIGGSVVIFMEAVPRLWAPGDPHVKGMFGLAILGVIVNGVAAWRISGGKTMNEKVLTWHLLEDVLGWVAVLIVSIVMYFRYIPVLDPILALLITGFILFNVIRKLVETMRIFLQGVPKGVEVDQIRKDVIAVDHVDSVHHLHIWSQDGEHSVISMHVVTKGVDSLEELVQVKCRVKDVLQPYATEHITIEMEVGEGDCSIVQ